MAKIEELKNYLTEEVKNNTEINATRVIYEYFRTKGMKKHEATIETYKESLKKGFDIQMIPEIASKLIRHFIKPTCPYCSQQMTHISCNTANGTVHAGYYCTACMVGLDMTIADLHITLANEP